MQVHKITTIFFCLTLILLAGCVSTAPSSSGISRMPGDVDYIGPFLDETRPAGNVVFVYHRADSFTLRIETDSDITVKTYDPEFEGLKYIDVTYPPFAGQFRGSRWEAVNKNSILTSEPNNDGLIAVIFLLSNKQGQLEAVVDIRSQAEYEKVIHMASGEGTDLMAFHVLAKYARLRGKFILE